MRVLLHPGATIVADLSAKEDKDKNKSGQQQKKFQKKVYEAGSQIKTSAQRVAFRSKNPAHQAHRHKNSSAAREAAVKNKNLAAKAVSHRNKSVVQRAASKIRNTAAQRVAISKLAAKATRARTKMPRSTNPRVAKTIMR